MSRATVNVQIVHIDLAAVLDSSAMPERSWRIVRLACEHEGKSLECCICFAGLEADGFAIGALDSLDSSYASGMIDV